MKFHKCDLCEKDMTKKNHEIEKLLAGKLTPNIEDICGVCEHEIIGAIVGCVKGLQGKERNPVQINIVDFKTQDREEEGATASTKKKQKYNGARKFTVQANKMLCELVSGGNLTRKQITNILCEKFHAYPRGSISSKLSIVCKQDKANTITQNCDTVPQGYYAVESEETGALEWWSDALDAGSGRVESSL